MFEVTSLDVDSQEAVIKVIGVGGCGGNAVNHMIRQNMQRAQFIVANTDVQALKNSQAKDILQLGSSLTRGLGAGANPQIGQEAAEESREKIIEAIEGADMLFITAGMGGGTGTGAAPVIAQIAKELDILTVAVVTRPFLFENKRVRMAQEGIDALAKYVNSLIIVPNEKLMQVLGDDVTLLTAYEAANDVLHGAVGGIAEIIGSHGLVNVDFADVKTIMSESGMAMMGSAKAAGPQRAKVAAENAVASPLLENVNLRDARGVLVNITAGPGFKMRELNDVMHTIGSFTAEDATVIYGNVINEDIPDDELRVTVVATGLGAPLNAAQPHGGRVTQLQSRQAARPVRAAQPQPVPGYITPVLHTESSNEAAPVAADNAPAVFRGRNREPNQLNAMRQAGMDEYEIPAFLRMQAN